MSIELKDLQEVIQQKLANANLTACLDELKDLQNTNQLFANEETVQSMSAKDIADEFTLQATTLSSLINRIQELTQEKTQQIENPDYENDLKLTLAAEEKITEWLRENHADFENANPTIWHTHAEIEAQDSMTGEVILELEPQESKTGKSTFLELNEQDFHSPQKDNFIVVTPKDDLEPFL